MATGRVSVNWARAQSTLCSASSRFYGNNEDDPHNVLDGGNWSWWGSAANVPLVDFQLDFQTVRLIDHVFIAFGADDGVCRNAALQFVVLSSADGMAWQQLAAGGDTTGMKYEATVHQEGKSALCLSWPTPMQCRFVKVQFQQLATGWINHAIQQIQCWGPGDGPSAHAMMQNCRGPPTFIYATDLMQMKDALLRGTMSSKMGMNPWNAPPLPQVGMVQMVQPMQMVQPAAPAPAPQPIGKTAEQLEAERQAAHKAEMKRQNEHAAKRQQGMFMGCLATLAVVPCCFCLAHLVSENADGLADAAGGVGDAAGDAAGGCMEAIEGLFK
mmetsp:Transcript_3885/g.9455  ORF Transcript_3885/g.9455 Transcript_3885/m.9455 type:complete len:327 (-) Transcript_3885:491-1471(-)|eukprot:CAMPEP_0178991158 /NCGR_PEP_ID=MMETSP0795-20121207/5364_1 /TAXON_ID=88552 /ORGANISM="Amoebophrya sp., Strain Ameob2" /LENGTH=326 /DNA_ID=CAMNT_0020682819 /DNA_START=220 /DNA_END=1200 /DNA_ORIENTATION=+